MLRPTAKTWVPTWGVGPCRRWGPPSLPHRWDLPLLSLPLALGSGEQMMSGGPMAPHRGAFAVQLPRRAGGRDRPCRDPEREIGPPTSPMSCSAPPRVWGRHPEQTSGCGMSESYAFKPALSTRGPPLGWGYRGGGSTRNAGVGPMPPRGPFRLALLAGRTQVPPFKAPSGTQLGFFPGAWRRGPYNRAGARLGGPDVFSAFFPRPSGSNLKAGSTARREDQFGHRPFWSPPGTGDVPRPRPPWGKAHPRHRGPRNQRGRGRFLLRSGPPSCAGLLGRGAPRAHGRKDPSGEGLAPTPGGRPALPDGGTAHPGWVHLDRPLWTVDCANRERGTVPSAPSFRWGEQAEVFSPLQFKGGAVGSSGTRKALPGRLQSTIEPPRTVGPSGGGRGPGGPGLHHLSGNPPPLKGPEGGGGLQSARRWEKR
jgi:hypothetical protein